MYLFERGRESIIATTADRRALGVLALVAFVVLGVGCTSTPAAPARSSAPAEPGPTQTEQTRPYVRGCGSSVFGNLGPHWRRGQITIGPVTFIGLRSIESAKPRRFTPKAGRSQGQKILAVVRSGVSVTVRVTPSEHAALLYDPRTFSAHEVSQGDSAVTFRSCKPGESPFGAQAARQPTQFNGAFIVDGPICVQLDARVSGGADVSRSIPFGRGETCV